MVRGARNEKPDAGSRHTTPRSGGTCEASGAAPSPTSKRVRGGRELAAQLVVPSPKTTPATAPSPFDSKLEAAYALILEYEKRTGEIKDWWHHPGSFTLADGKRYRPDFMVQRADGSLEMIEVKGWHKNRRDSLTHVAWFAQRFKCFTVRIVWKQDGRWDGKYITGGG